MRCFQHFDREALGSCVNCGKGVCLDCLNKAQGRIYCGGCQTSGSSPSAGGSHPVGNSGISIQISSGTQRLFNDMMASAATSATVISDKNRFLAALLAFCAGSFGLHKFYLGQMGWGFLYLCFCWTGIPTLAGFVEGVLYVTRSDQDFIRRYGLTVLSHPQAAALMQTTVRAQPVTPKEYERFLLQFAQRHRGQISIVHLMAEAELRLDKVEDALARLTAKGMVQSEMDDNGHVRYYVPEFRKELRE